MPFFTEKKTVYCFTIKTFARYRSSANSIFDAPLQFLIRDSITGIRIIPSKFIFHYVTNVKGHCCFFLFFFEAVVWTSTICTCFLKTRGRLKNIVCFYRKTVLPYLTERHLTHCGSTRSEKNYDNVTKRFPRTKCFLCNVSFHSLQDDCFRSCKCYIIRKPPQSSLVSINRFSLSSTGDERNLLELGQVEPNFGVNASE